MERDRLDAIASLRGDRAWLLPVHDAPPDVAGVLAYSHGGRCVFHQDGCEIQHTCGEAALPSACRHFPRQVLIDPRGVFVTLSHYCPTAADLLFEDDRPLQIVNGPPAVPSGDPEGLDARDVLPPLLTRGVLMDYAGYDAWEAHMVRTLTSGAVAPEAALAVLDAHSEVLQRWRPGAVSLADTVNDLSTGDTSGHSTHSSFPSEFFPVVKRFLAAHAFASWAVYQGNGLPSVMRALHRALAVLQAESITVCAIDGGELDAARLKRAISQTDLRLVHLAERFSISEAAHDGSGTAG